MASRNNKTRLHYCKNVRFFLRADQNVTRPYNYWGTVTISTEPPLEIHGCHFQGGKVTRPPLKINGRQKLQTPYFLLLRGHCLLGEGAPQKSKDKNKGWEVFKLDFLQVGGSRR